MDVVALASILVGARRVAAFLIGLDQRAIGDLLARIDFQNARGGDDRRLFDRAVRLRLDIGRQRRQEFGAQRRALARQPALESFAVGGQSGEQVAAISFAGGDDVQSAGRTDRRLKAAQIDRHIARTEDDLRGSSSPTAACRRRFRRRGCETAIGGDCRLAARDRLFPRGRRPPPRAKRARPDNRAASRRGAPRPKRGNAAASLDFSTPRADPRRTTLLTPPLAVAVSSVTNIQRSILQREKS